MLAQVDEHNVDLWLERMAPNMQESPWEVPWHFYCAGSGRRQEHVVIGFVTHGNEMGTLPAAGRLVEELVDGTLLPEGPVSILLGNIEACRENERFLEEDFNRVFTFDGAAASLERQRADEVRPLLDQADIFLDFHQTQTPTESAFWTFPWSTERGQWARVIGAAPMGLTRAPGGAFSAGRRCLDEYVRDRGKEGLTAELGMKGWHVEQAKEAYKASLRLIAAADSIALGEATLAELSREGRDIEWYQTRHIVPQVSKQHVLREGVGNWQAVEKGELLSAPGAPKIEAAESGRVLFPKYPHAEDPIAPELYRLGVPISDPDAGFG